MMSCAGNPHLMTPAMDGLARGGARFERAYCANPVCAPSRAAMLTGVMPSRMGAEHNEDLLRAKIPESILENSLGRICRSAGFETAYGGRIGLPVTAGQLGFESISDDHRGKLADDCADFLGRKHDKPFLLVASFINPHDICYMAIQSFEEAEGKKKAAAKADDQPPHLAALAEAMKRPEGVPDDEFFGRLCPRLPDNFEIPRDEPEAVNFAVGSYRKYARENWSAEQWRLHRWAYCRLTERVDAEIATVLQALEANGLADDTVIVFSSDHGEMDSAHRLNEKSVLYEEAVRVPFIVRFNGETRPGLVNGTHLVSSGLDLIPTLCDYAGIEVPPGLTGRSVRALAAGKPPGAWRNSLVVESKPSRMLRSKRFKYTVYGYGEPREALVDLESDPGEMKNLAPDLAYRDVLSEHRTLLRDGYRDNGDALDPRYIV
jgi:arylsulfatase A-like enzyme